MTRKEYATKGTLTASQVQFRKEHFKKYHSTRRKINVVGGIVCGAIVYKSLPYLHIDISQPLENNDIFKIMTVYMLLLFVFRLIRQQIQAVSTPTDYVDEEVIQTAESLTPQQAEQILKEDAERMNAYPKDKAKSNISAFVLVIAVLCVVYYVFKVKGV